MKLTYIADIRMPSERAHPYQILKMCEALGKRVDIRLVLSFRFQTTKKLKQVRDIWTYYGINRKFKIVKLPSFDLIWLDSYTLKFSSSRFLLQASSFAFLATLYSLFDKADVYYTRDALFASFFGSLRFLHRRKIYYEAHNYTSLASKLMKKRKVDGLIVITNKLKELYMKEGVPEEKILVAPLSVDLSMFDRDISREEARKNLHLPQKSKIIGYTGKLRTMEIERGIGTLIEAFKLIKAQRKDVVLCMVGGPDDMIQQYLKIAHDEGLDKDIIFTGHVPPYQVPAYLCAFDVCVMPFPRTENTAYYMSPLRLFESMVAKRPIVASDFPSLREVLINGENAILFEPDNARALAGGIAKVLADDKLANKIAQNAYKEGQHYTYENRAGKMLDYILNSLKTN